jgi:hypothetical protein
MEHPAADPAESAVQSSLPTPVGLQALVVMQLPEAPEEKAAQPLSLQAAAWKNYRRSWPYW